MLPTKVTMVTVNWLRLLFRFTLDRLEHQELKLLDMLETTYQSILITRCNAPASLGALCAAIPRANAMKYQLQFVFYCVSYIECSKCRMSYCFCGVTTLCPIDFRCSGHFILSLLSFLYQLLDVAAFKNVIPAKYKSKNYYPILIKNYLNQSGEKKICIVIYCNCNRFIIMMFINVSFIVNLAICLTSLLN